ESDVTRCCLISISQETRRRAARRAVPTTPGGHVASQTSRIIEDLTGAVLDLNDALSSVHDGRAERTALERFVRILRKAVDRRSLWTELEGLAAGSSPLDARASAESFLMLISTALGDAHADLLDRCGYRVPPPPPAERLIEQ